MQTCSAQTLQIVLHQGMLVDGGLAREGQYGWATVQQQGAYQGFISTATCSLGQQSWRSWHHDHSRRRLNPRTQGPELPPDHRTVHGLSRDDITFRQRLKR
jgi:multimeric flavodoxin WrbA